MISVTFYLCYGSIYLSGLSSATSSYLRQSSRSQIPSIMDVVTTNLLNCVVLLFVSIGIGLRVIFKEGILYSASSLGLARTSNIVQDRCNTDKFQVVVTGPILFDSAPHPLSDLSVFL